MALPGFRDFYPDDCAFRNAIFTKWREVAHRYGFVEYDGPPLEPLDLFTKKSGEEIVGQLYHFKDKGDREVALRPEMTPTLARLVTARHKDFKKPLKWFSIPQVFRYERQQKGRLREHYQFNCDIIGEAGLEADIELIALVIDTLRAFGLTEKDFVVRLSDRQFWTTFCTSRLIPENHYHDFFQIIDKIERTPKDETMKKLDALQKSCSLDTAQGGDLSQHVFDILEGREKFEIGQKNILPILTGLKFRGFENYVRPDFTVVRGLAYYTGVVFEVFDRSGEFRAIAGGGRYDTLLKNLGGVDLPALGFGMGDVVLGEILKAKKFECQPISLDMYVAFFSYEFRTEAMKLVQECRTAGFAVDYGFKAGSWNKQVELAQSKNAAFLCVFGDKLKDGKVEIRELSSRQDESLPIDEVIAFLHQKLRSISENMEADPSTSSG